MLYRHYQALSYNASLQSEKSEDTWLQVEEEAKQIEIQKPVFQNESPSFLERVSTFGSNIFSRIFGHSEPDEDSYSYSALPVGVPQYVMNSQQTQSSRSSGVGSNSMPLVTSPSQNSSLFMSTPGGQHTSDSRGFDGAVAKSQKLRTSGLPLGVPRHVVNFQALFSLPSQKSKFFSSTIFAEKFAGSTSSADFQPNIAAAKSQEKRNSSSR